ncbi:hypothetical protein F7R05_11990 [Pseudomonas koreensis]|nr:hypothetical protein F7R05_11990 [Pseudomonas koreensis]
MKAAQAGHQWRQQIARATQIHCGSEPAREEPGTCNICVVWHTAFASRLAPTGFVLSFRMWGILITRPIFSTKTTYPARPVLITHPRGQFV